MAHRYHLKKAGELVTASLAGATVVAAALLVARWVDQHSPHATLAPNMPFFQAPKAPPPSLVSPAVS